MPVVRCPNLHTYPTEKYRECPYCKKMDKYVETKKKEWESRSLDEVFPKEQFVNQDKLYLTKDEYQRNANLWGRPVVNEKRAVDRERAGKIIFVIELLALLAVVLYSVFFGFV